MADQSLQRQRQQLHGLILAGGQSSRMGTDKALLQINGQPLLYRLASQLAALGMKVTVAAGSPEREREYRAALAELAPQTSFEFDRYPGCGPLSGLHAGLATIDKGWVFVVACDMPSISQPLLEKMSTLLPSPGERATVVHAPGQPMHAFYEASLHTQVEGALQRGDYRFMRLLEEQQKIEVSPTIEEASIAFMNMNTPEAYARYISELEEAGQAQPFKGSKSQ
ncbi:molybdenum cofactor guanylyltransferase [Paenibacillus harenae]|uniref:Probable molybdenum cofactor guanylyltransferase n=1 Tax=Paenibacillus harenae TaxID=306543 RepID=A0ABT9U3B5_PAEHA|nr:molybdenum cofactor guanylyltransferase [Paenibacillus harenae]MDQ0113546.1 molybdopterin-guanine dinucleotide biosynthesis protein A [Paenibacillus harenae]